MATVEQVTLIRSGLDASGYTRGAEAIARANERIAASGQRTAQTGRRVEDVGRAYDRLARSIDPAIRGQERLAAAERTLTAAVERGFVARAEADRLLALAERRYLGLNAAMQRTTVATQQAAQGTRLAGHQITNLTYQVQDAAVQLAGGQNPLLILMQQGPQATAAVGGTGNALRLLAQQVTPARVAMVGLGVAAGTTVAVMEGTERRVAALRGSLRGFQADYASLARELERDIRRQAIDLPLFDRSEIEQVRTALGQFLPPEMRAQAREFTETILGMGRAMEDIPGAVDTARRAWRDAASVAADLAERGVRGFNEDVRRQVELLQLSGDRVGAFNLVMQTLRGTFAEAARDGSALEQAVGGVRSELRSFWDEVRSGVEGAGAGLLDWYAQALRRAREFRAETQQATRGSALGALNGFLPMGDAAAQLSRGGGAPAAGAVSVAVPRGEREAVANTLFDGLVRAGLSPAAAAGIVANAHAESGFNPRAIGDSGASAGLFQWRGSRREAFRAFAGVDPSEADVETQIRFLLREMAGETGDAGARRAGEILRQPGITAADAGAAFSRFFERPAAGDFAARSRGAAAEAFARRFAGREVGAPASATAAPGAPRAEIDPEAAFGAAALGGPARAGAAEASEVTRSRFVDDALRDARRAGVPLARGEEIERQIQRFEEARREVAEGSNEYRILTQRIEQLRAAQNGLENSTDRTVRALAQQREIAELGEGPLREVAEAIQQAREAARGEGRDLTTADEARIQAEVLGRIAAERRQVTEATERQVAAEQRIGAAWRESAEAALLAEARERAQKDLRLDATRLTAAEAAEVERLAQGYVALARAQAERNLAPQIRQQQQQIELLRLQQSLVGADPATMSRALARRQEEIRLENQFPGLSRTPGGQEAIRNAEEAAILQEQIRRTKEMENVGREVGSAFFDAIRGGLLEGRSWKEISQNLNARLTEIMSRELLEKPLEQFFGSLFASLFRGMQGGGGSGSNPLGSQAGNLLSGVVGALFGGGSVGADGAIGEVASGAFGNAVTSALGGGFKFHRGGWVGQHGQPFVAPAALWRNVPSYHSGGVAGMRPFVSDDEVLAKLKRNELVLNDNQQRRVGRAMSGGGRPIVVNNNTTVHAPNPAAFNATVPQITTRAGQQIARALRRNG